MRFEFERVLLRIEARRACQRADEVGDPHPAGARAILAQDTAELARWDDIAYRQWRERHGLERCPPEDPFLAVVDAEIAGAFDDEALWPETLAVQALHNAGVGG